MNFHTVKRRYYIAFFSKPLSKSCFHGRCICPHNPKQRRKVLARISVEKYSAQHKTLQSSIAAYEIKVFALYRVKIRSVLRK